MRGSYWEATLVLKTKLELNSNAGSIPVHSVSSLQIPYLQVKMVGMRNKLFIIPLFLFLFSCASAYSEPLTRSTTFQPAYDAGTPETSVYAVELPEPEEVRLPPPSEDSGERIRPLRQGESSPFNGVLFNGPAVARLEIEFRGQAARCLIERRTDQQRLIARALFDIQVLQNTLETERRVQRIFLESRDNELNRLYSTSNELLRRSSPNVLNTVLWTAGGLLTGAGIMSTIYLLTRP